MMRKALLLSISFAGVSLLGVRGASAQFLANNFWPNPGLNTLAPPGIDQVYSYYNSPPPTYTPYTSGDTNPRPAGWHRGGGDFGVTSTHTYDFYNTAGNRA